MDFIFEFIGKYGALITPLAIFIVGWLLPTPKFFTFGSKVAETIPPQLAKLIAERLKAFERGLLDEELNGDKSIVSNSQVEEKVKNLKIDLGLED